METAPRNGRGFSLRQGEWWATARPLYLPHAHAAHLELLQLLQDGLVAGIIGVPHRLIFIGSAPRSGTAIWAKTAPGWMPASAQLLAAL